MSELLACDDRLGVGICKTDEWQDVEFRLRHDLDQAVAPFIHAAGSGR